MAMGIKIATATGIMIIMMSVTTESISYEDDQPNIMVEFLPDHYQTWLSQRDESLHFDNLTPSQKSLINVGLQWHSDEMPLSVCFLDGSKNIQRKIKDIALDWQVSSSAVQFAFNDGFNETKDCDEQQHAIRITFKGHGVWSSLARESASLASHQATMILGQFDRTNIDDATFNRWVLHEFGHALGFVHEHQSPDVGCMNEYNMPELVHILKATPYGWTDDEIAANLAQLEPDGLMSGGFDPASIMLYSFEPKYYHQGTASVCYHPATNALSDEDKRFTKVTYPLRPADDEKSVQEQRMLGLSSLYALELQKTALSEQQKTQSLNAFKSLLAPSGTMRE